jgi:hypothetical protein
MTNDKALEAALDAYWDADPGPTDTSYREAMQAAISAYLSALPGEAEVVATAWDYMGEGYVDFVAMLDKHEIEQGRVTNIRPLVTLSSLQAMQARAEAAERERDHWKANHAEMVQRNAVLRERPDLPADRLPSIARYEARVKELEEAVRGLLGIVDDSAGVSGYHLNGDVAEWDEFAEVEAARTALKGVSNG